MSGIRMIVAVQKSNFGIGYNNDIIFSIKEDLENFKKITLGHTVVMGYKTWKSLPDKFKPLPGRTNIVLSREKKIDGVIMKRNTNEVFQMIKENPFRDVFIMGGGELYKQFLPYTKTIYLTTVEGQNERPASIFFPNKSDWENDFILKENGDKTAGIDRMTKENISYTFQVYENKNELQY